VKRTILPFLLIFLAALVAIPNLNIPPTAKASGSASWSFRDDFNYTSISQLQAAGWTTESIAPASYYSVGNSILTLLNDGHVGAGAGYSNVPANVSDWSVSTRVDWIGSSGNVSGYVGSLQVVAGTVKHQYDWMADGYYGKFWIGVDGHNVASFASYSKQLNVWHILQLDMIHGTLYGYFDGYLVGSYTEPDTTPGNTNLINIQALASWETNNNFDWMQANNSPPQPPPSPTYPYFTISANPNSITLTAGQSADSTIQLQSQANFSGPVSLSATVEYGGLSPQTTPATVALSKGGSATATLTVASQASTPAGGNYVIVTATGGTVSASATLTVTVSSGPPPPNSDFTISESPNSQTIPLGSEQQTTLDLDSVNGFFGNVNLVATPSSSAIACWFTYTLTSTATLYIPSNGSAYQYPTCGAYGAAGSYSVKFSATSGSLNHSIILPVTITDFSISASSVSFTAPSGTGTLALSSLSGLSGPVSLGVSSPSAVTASCPPSATLTSGGTTSVPCSFISTVSGTYNVTITGSFVCYGCYYDGNDSHSVTISVKVSQPSQPDFYATANPSGLAVTPGSSATSTITVTSLGFTGAVNLAVSISPTGPTASMSPVTITLVSGGTGTSTLTLSTTSTIPTGSYQITVKATSGALAHSIVLSLSVSNSGFTISDSPASQAIPLGSEMQTDIYVNSVNGFSGNVNLVATPSSTAVACWFAYTLTNKATVYVPSGGYADQYPTCGAYGAVGSYTVTITGTSGSLSYSIILPVTVMDYTISASAVSFTAGSSGISSLSLTSLSGLSGPVTLSVSAPPGLSASCSSSLTLSPGGTATGSCTFTAASPGNYTATVTGTFVCSGCYYDGTDSHSTTATVTVTSTDPPVSSTVNFQGVTVTTTGSLTVVSGIVSGTISVMATNSSTGALLFSKTYVIATVQVANNHASFLLNVPVSPYPLSADISVTQDAGVWSASVMVTRQLDITKTGTVNILDFSIVTFDYGSSPGGSRYNPAADLTASGTVNIIDVSIMGYYYNAPVFY
jgi:hypothetical protein